jgi:hypothetical protein
LAETTETVRVWHYFCINPFGEAGECSGTSTGAPLAPGIAACDPSHTRQIFLLDGLAFRCGDTGAFSGAAVDIFCYSPFAWGFPPDTTPCPAFDDWETVTWLP